MRDSGWVLWPAWGGECLELKGSHLENADPGWRLLDAVLNEFQINWFTGTFGR